MAKYVLSPSYGDMSTIVLGGSVKTIKKAFRKHWEDELKFPNNYYEDTIKKIHEFLEKDHKSIEEIDNDYSENFDEDYSFEEAY